MPPVPRTGSCADHLKMASAQPVRLTRDSILMKLFLALAAERQAVIRAQRFARQPRCFDC
jgi:hypothetical protein